MQVVLEAVADAVSQLILFSIEAEENKSVLPNISTGAAGVSKAVQILINIGEGLAAKYGSEERIQRDMRAACGRLRQSSATLDSTSRTISSAGFTEQAKKQLLDAARVILESTVSMLQLADSFDVIQISKAGRYAEQEVASARNVRNMNELVESTRALSHRNLNLINLSKERITLITDPGYRRRLDTANGVLQHDAEPYLTALKDTVQNPNAAPAVQDRNRAQLDTNGKRLQEAVTEIILVARLSSQHMWDRVNLDINALMRGKLPPLEALREIGRELDQELDNLTKAVAAHNRPDAERAMKKVQDAVNEEAALGTAVSEMTPDPQQRRDIVKAVEDLERGGEPVAAATEQALDNPFDPRYLDALNKAVERLKLANKNLLDKARGAPDRLLQAHDDINKDLDRLVDAVNTRDEPKARAALKDLPPDIEREGEAAKVLADRNPDPMAKLDVQRELDQLRGMPPKLQQSATTALARPTDPEARRQFDKDVADTRDHADKLKEAALPLDKEIEVKAKELEENLGKLSDALKDGRREDAVPLAKSVPKDVDAQADRVRRFGDRVDDDPVVQREFHQDAKDMHALVPPLQQATKALLQDPKDAAALRQLDDTVSRINLLNDKVVRAARAQAEKSRGDLEADLLKALERLRAALDKLTADTARNNRPGAQADLKDAVTEMRREADLAGVLADRMPEPQRGAAHREADKLVGMTPALEGAARDALDQRGPATQKQLEKVVEEVKAQAARVPEALKLSPEHQLGKHGKELNDLLDQLYDAAKGQQKQPFDALTQVVPKKIQEQADRAKGFARDADDPFRKKQLLADASTLEKIPPPLLDAARKVFANPADAPADQALQELIDRVKAINARLADPAAAFLTPADKVVKDVEDLRKAAHEPNRRGADDAMRALRQDVPELTSSVNEAMRDVDDPAVRKKVAADIAAIEKLTPQVPPVANEAIARPKDAAAQQRLDDLLDKVKELAERLGEAEIRASPEIQIVDKMAEIDKDRDALKEAAVRGDKGALNDSLQRLVDDLRKQAALARKMEATSADPERARRFGEIANAMDALVPRLEDVVRRLQANPYDKEAQKQLEALTKEIDDLNDRLLDLVREENQAKLEKAMEKLLDAVRRGDDPTPQLKEVAALLKKQSIIARAMAARCTDPKRRRELLQAAQDLQDAIRNIIGAARDAAAGKADGLRRLEDLINRTLDTAASMRPPPSDPLMAAAAEIDEGLSKRKQRTLADQPEGSAAWRLLQSSRRIAELMAQLAIAAKNRDKKQIILLSRAIAEEVNNATKAANEIAASCRDPRLRDALAAHVAPLKTYSVQLKILTAVKASTPEDDKSTKQQLVTAAKGIAANVVASVNAAEAALIYNLKGGHHK